MRCRAYVDGFNLYYGALKHRRVRWLDLPAMSRGILPDVELKRVVYCTAKVKERASDPGAGTRQNVYLRALGADPMVEVLFGRFQVSNSDAQRRADANCSCCSQTPPGCKCCAGPIVPIVKTEEKGSDVHLGVRLVADAYEDEYDVALVVSGDADLQPAIDVVRTRVGKRVVVVDPRNRPNSVKGDERRDLRESLLRRCRLPDPLHLGDGRVLRAPRGW